MTPPQPAIWCVIPAKGFLRAKSRLADTLTVAQRSELARAMFTHVYSVCASHPRVTGVVVATDDDDVHAMAASRRADVVRDTGTMTLGEIVDAALTRAERLGATQTVVVMSDLPRLDAVDLDVILGELSGGRMVIAPDRAEAGTNALALHRGSLARTCFGRVDSFVAHQRAARAAGVGVAIVRRDGIAFDVDTPDDYRLLNL